MTEQFLSLKNISKRYVGVQALDDIDFEINKGEIHCLVGENGSGKSTLIKIISGVVKPDDGSHITIEGQRIQDFQAIDAIHHGVEVIYQDLSIFPNLTVAENIALSEIVASGQQFIKWENTREIATEAMKRLGVNLQLDKLVGEISLADQQLVAICRALTHDVRLVIMDEPTTALTKKEVDALFAIVKDMQSTGISTMFISHKLDEVFQIAERVTILRDGKKVGTYASEDLDDEKLTMLMTGKKIEYKGYVVEDLERKEVILELRNLSKKGNYKDINLKLHTGEILGITGLLGSGRTELALSIFGLNPADSGEILVLGQPIKITSTQEALELGIGYVPENRFVQGLVMQQSVGKNIVITILQKLLNRLGLIDNAKRIENINRWVDELSIGIPSIDSPVQTLSGGNQQRVVLAKWIATNPKILIMDGPTVGVDVAAKSAIHEIIRGLANKGLGVIIISDEISEVFYHCNRVLVMHKGRLITEFNTSQTSINEIQNAINQNS